MTRRPPCCRDVVKAKLPGLKKDDVDLELDDPARRAILEQFERWSGEEEKLPHCCLGLEITMCRSGFLQGVGPVDEDIECAVIDPLNDLQGALPPLID